MNADNSHSSLLNAMLDGTLDAAGEKAVLDLLAADPTVREEFARLAQMHAWLAADDRTRVALAATEPTHRRIITHPAWWLAAAIAVAVIIITASRLWPAPGAMESLTGHERIHSLLHTACSHCHARLDLLLTGNSATGMAMIVPGHPEISALWLRLSGDNRCARSLDAAGKSRLREWITADSRMNATT